MENTMVPPQPDAEMKDPRPKVVFCIPGRQFSDTFLQSWTGCVLNLFAKYNIVLSNRYSSMVNFARAMCLGADVKKGPDQKPFQGELEYDCMVWLDSDMAFNVETIDELIQKCLKDYPVVSGTYLMDGGKHVCCVEKWDTEYYKKNGSFEFLSVEQYKEKIENKEHTLKSDYCGMGCMAIRKGIIEDDRMKYPWFFRNIEEFKDDSGNVVIRECVSEDVAFIRNLIESGVISHVNVELNLRFGHEKTVLF
jgi:hypothetical protein